MHHRAPFIRILKSIHAAGVADGKEDLSIIDFDRAKYRNHRAQKRAERQRLEDLLDGDRRLLCNELCSNVIY